MGMDGWVLLAGWNHLQRSSLYLSTYVLKKRGEVTLFWRKSTISIFRDGEFQQKARFYCFYLLFSLCI